MYNTCFAFSPNSIFQRSLHITGQNISSSFLQYSFYGYIELNWSATGCFQSFPLLNNVILHVCKCVCKIKILKVELLFQRVYSFVILIHITSLSSLGVLHSSKECRKVPLSSCSYQHNIVKFLADIMGRGRRFPIVVLVLSF